MIGVLQICGNEPIEETMRFDDERGSILILVRKMDVIRHGKYPGIIAIMSVLIMNGVNPMIIQSISRRLMNIEVIVMTTIRHRRSAYISRPTGNKAIQARVTLISIWTATFFARSKPGWIYSLARLTTGIIKQEIKEQLEKLSKQD